MLKSRVARYRPVLVATLVAALTLLMSVSVVFAGEGGGPFPH